MTNTNKDFYLVFDLDGTLINSSKGIYYAYQNALKNSKINIKTIEFNQFIQNIGPPFEKMLRDIHPNISKKESSIIIKNFREKYDSEAYLMYEVYENIMHCLIELKRLNFFLYVLSNKRDLPTKHIILKEFPNVFSNIWGKKGKDFDKAKILKNLKNENPNSKILFIGDTISDLESSINAGVKFLYVSYGFGEINQRKNSLIKCNDPIFLKDTIIKYLKNYH